MAKIRSRVPKVLWKLFGNRARTLAETITSLVPPSPPAGECRCRGRRCLGCIREDAMSFLLRSNDSAEYHKLLTQCFVVVSDQAPSLSGFYPEKRWSQLEIVRRTIEMILSEKSTCPNVICCGYDKSSRSSAAVKLLTCAAWALLLRRIGDDLMVYLLKNTSIFLSLPRKKHQQVAGFSISKLCPNFLKHIKKLEHQSSSLVLGKKRKRTENDSMQEKCKLKRSLGIDIPSSSICCTGCKSSSICSQKSSHEDATKINGPPRNPNSEESSNGKGQKGNCANPRKRFREFRWLRQRKRRLLASQESYGGTPCVRNLSEEEVNLSGKLKYDIDANFKMPLQCSCCFVFRTLPKITAKALINRQSMFYKLEYSSSVLPRKHILNSLKSNKSAAIALYNDIFGPTEANSSAPSMTCFHSSDCCLIGSTCLYHSLIKVLKTLIRKSRCCNHTKLLNKHCNIPSIDQISNPNNSYCLKKQVVSFIWAVCRSIIPQDLLGTPSNWRNVRRNISKFIKLRRFEKFSLKQCMHKLKSSNFPFLSNKHSLCYVSDNDPTVMKRKIFESWIYWLFSCLVVPLVQANFYATESEHGKQEVFYYQKSTWENLMDKSVISLKDQSYRLLTASSVKNILKNRSFGFSRVRFRPKGNGIRPLANLRASSRIPIKKICSKTFPKIEKYNYFMSVNSVLRDLHIVLKGIQAKEPEKLGSSVFDYNDVYQKIRPFLSNLKSELRTVPSVYIVVSDVLKAFDSVDQDKLLNVMKDLIINDDYVMKKSHRVVCVKKCLQVQQNLILANQDTRFSSSFPRSADSVLIDQEWSKSIRKEELLHNINEHVKRNVLQLNKKFYLQNVGIPQGSVLSSLLCSFYYGNLEKSKIYPFLKKAGGPVAGESSLMNGGDEATSPSPKIVLLRFIDDFLFISTSKKQAEMFFSRLRRGFREYNCYMNEAKFGFSFNTDEISGLQSNRVYVGEDGISFVPWSGLFINSCTLEVQADYTRYLNTHLSSTLTVRWHDKPGRHLKSKLRDYLRPKCHPIFYDSNINSAAVVRLNIYQAFLLCGMKFHCYVCELSDVCRLSPDSYMDIILKSLRYMHKLIKRRMHLMETGPDFRPTLRVEKGEVEWLGLTAYARVLKRKQTRYKELLALLKVKLRENKKEGSISSALKYAVHESHSSIIWKIKY